MRPVVFAEAHPARWWVSILLVAGALAWPAAGVAQATALDRPARLTVMNERLDVALRGLERAAGVSVVYSPDLVPVARRVSCDCAEVTVGAALEQMLAGTGVVVSATATSIRLAPRPPGTNGVHGRLVGVVSDGQTGAPVASATVMAGGVSTITNTDGRFIVLGLDPGPHDVHVSSMGWAGRTVRDVVVEPGGTTTVSVELDQAAIPLAAVVVSPGRFALAEQTPEVSVRTLTRQQLETAPQLGEDVFRSLKRLPGVASGDISTKLYVRGGTPREVLVRLDGVDLYEPYHLKDFDGALGIVDIQSLGGIDFYAGGFPVDYGNGLAGVMDMETRTPPATGQRTTVGLSITNASFMSQGAFAEGRGQWLFSARRGYLDIALSFTDSDPGISPVYYDVLGKVQYRLGPRNLVSGHVLFARDHLDLNTADGATRVDLGTYWGSEYGWITWKTFPTPRLRFRSSVIAGRVTGRRGGSALDPDRARGPEYVESDDRRFFDFAGVQTDGEWDPTDDLALRFGIDVKRLAGDYAYASATRSLVAGPADTLVARWDSTRVALAPGGDQLSAYLSARVRPLPRATLEGGVRYDAFQHTGDADLAPRLSASLDLAEHTALRASAGRYYQAQGIHELHPADGETRFTPSERATQLALGLEQELGRGVAARIEAYTRSIDRPRPEYVNLWNEVLPFPELDGDRVRLEPEEARARGVELLVSASGHVWDASATYVLSMAEERLEEGWVPRSMDQRHATTLSLGFHPNPKWFAAVAWHWHSGWPFTPQAWVADTLTVFRDQGREPLHLREVFGPTNSVRLPAYHRLDVRVTRRFQLGRGQLDVYADIFNAYDQVNLASYGYDLRWYGNRLLRVQYPDQSLLPFLPSIGFRWEF